jgi:hypothetical protein
MAMMSGYTDAMARPDESAFLWGQKLRLLLVLANVALALAETAGGVKWSMPPGWKAQAARPMRAATYRAPAAAGDKEDAECAVYYFGPGQGGSVEANLKRWIGQFEQPGGKPPEEAAKVRRQTIHGLRVTTVDVSGTYTGMGGPMAVTKSSKPGYRLLGAIVEAPEGAVFIKFTGPAKTVAANQAAFQSLLQSLSRS